MQPLFVHKCVREKYEWVAYTTTNKKKQNQNKGKVQERHDIHHYNIYHRQCICANLNGLNSV